MNKENLISIATAFQLLNKDQLRETLRELRLTGASVRQLERLTGVSRGIILLRYAIEKMSETERKEWMKF